MLTLMPPAPYIVRYVFPQNSIAYKAKAMIDKVASGKEPAVACS